jgi:broad specificity phosphatase PhoE
MRLFIFARHAESSANAAGVVNSDPSHEFGLTPRGKRQAEALGEQLAHIRIDQAVCTRFARTRQTIELALRGNDTPLRVEPDLDEIRAGAFDGAPIDAYWAWKERHRRSDRFPGGESPDDAARRYASALRRLLARQELVTVIVCHESALRYVIDAAADRSSIGHSQVEIANAAPFLFDEPALRRAVVCLKALASSPALEPAVADVAA